MKTIRFIFMFFSVLTTISLANEFIVSGAVGSPVNRCVRMKVKRQGDAASLNKPVFFQIMDSLGGFSAGFNVFKDASCYLVPLAFVMDPGVDSMDFYVMGSTPYLANLWVHAIPNYGMGVYSDARFNFNVYAPRLTLAIKSKPVVGSCTAYTIFRDGGHEDELKILLRDDRTGLANITFTDRNCVNSVSSVIIPSYTDQIVMYMKAITVGTQLFEITDGTVVGGVPAPAYSPKPFYIQVLAQ